jgi:antitoxin VapB
MAFHIRNSEAEESLRRLCELTGESLTEAVLKSVNLRLEAELKSRQDSEEEPVDLLAKYRAVSERLSRLPILDPRSPDDIIGYDERGMPS